MCDYAIGPGCEGARHDGEDIGSVDRAVVDPRTNEVTHIVVRTGTIFGRDIMVPREDLERGSLDGDTIQLDLSKDELKQFPDFVMEQYSAPPRPGSRRPATGSRRPGTPGRSPWTR